MVRLTMQPLVENALQHAFREGLEPHHYIRIDAVETEDEFRVCVEDNGLGMPPEKLASLRAKLAASGSADEAAGAALVPEKTILRRGGIGLGNVHRRIRMVYGEDYGLTIDSEEGRGTRITMRMPRRG
jgi:two-component system sensor histidine kinase YesM